MSERLDKILVHRKRNLVIGVLIAHTIQILLYGLAFYWIIKQGELGSMTTESPDLSIECIYFSVSNYTSLGIGDIFATGTLRFVAGFEALTG